ncbi:MAG: hypothetical protein C0631_04870 [Sedimenticola sp.]|jgi:hypothetical protein|nr:MAG: hypothetical protein C0631_04870 [Sedimenticola sp.]
MDSVISDVLSMTSMKTDVQIATAVLKKQNDIMKQQGAMVLQMIQSVSPSSPQGSLGHNIDVTA